MGSFVAFQSLPLPQASLPTPLQEAVLLSCSPFPSPSPLFIPAPSLPPRRLACLLSASSSPRTPGLTTGRTHDRQQAGCGQFVDSSGKGLSHQCEKYFGAVNPQPGVALTSSCRGQVGYRLPAALPRRLPRLAKKRRPVLAYVPSPLLHPGPVLFSSSLC